MLDLGSFRFIHVLFNNKVEELKLYNSKSTNSYNTRIVLAFCSWLFSCLHFCFINYLLFFMHQIINYQMLGFYIFKVVLQWGKIFNNFSLFTKIYINEGDIWWGGVIRSGKNELCSEMGWDEVLGIPRWSASWAWLKGMKDAEKGTWFHWSSRSPLQNLNRHQLDLLRSWHKKEEAFLGSRPTLGSNHNFDRISADRPIHLDLLGPTISSWGLKTLILQSYDNQFIV